MWNQIAKVERDRIVVTVSTDGSALSLTIGSQRPDGSSGPFIRVFDRHISDKIKVLIDEALNTVSDNRPPPPPPKDPRDYVQASVPASLSNQDKSWAQQQYDRRRNGGKDRGPSTKRRWDDDE